MENKYDFELDMIGDNSNSLILRQILPQSLVLEFGPAYGRMTKFLKHNLNCKVTIVEKEVQSGMVASNFAEYSFIGEYWGDIEKYNWINNIIDIGYKYDYIIFADVLEHLYNPLKALSSVKTLLKENGSVLISVPNITHNSVIIDLLNNKFEYREIGLLDNTHIRFFTRTSLKRMVTDAGFVINKTFDTHNAVENTEFRNSFEDIPESVATFLKQKEDGDVYQFVWSLIKYS
jgi:2-polyprenyl-3-methyl-5-hydroxy-6-metoxy-1,4-benzoquinol methylase